MGVIRAQLLKDGGVGEALCTGVAKKSPLRGLGNSAGQKKNTHVYTGGSSYARVLTKCLAPSEWGEQVSLYGNCTSISLLGHSPIQRSTTREDSLMTADREPASGGPARVIGRVSHGSLEKVTSNVRPTWLINEGLTLSGTGGTGIDK